VLACRLCQLLLLAMLLLGIAQLQLLLADVSGAALPLLLLLVPCGIPASHCMLAAGMGDGVDAAGDIREPEVEGDHRVGSCLALSWLAATASWRCWPPLLLQLLGLGLITYNNSSTARSRGLLQQL
jgi:hypothetical protein